MAQSRRQPQWNIYEAVVLLDGYLETFDGDKTKSNIIRRVSKELRQMAICNGQTIDEVYRNENGISYQIQSMDSAYKGHRVYVPATKLFLETVEIYRNDRDRFNSLLKEARSMTEKTSTIKDQYMTWLAAKVTKAQYNEALSCYPEIENFCMKIQVLRKPLFETDDLKTIRRVQQEVYGNKFFHQTHKKQIKKYIAAIQLYSTFIKDRCREPVIADQKAQDITINIECSDGIDEIQINEKTFRNYLIETLKLSEATCRSYVSAVHTAENFAKEHGFDYCKIYNADKSEISAVIEALLRNKNFISFNESQHKRFTSVFAKVLELANNTNIAKYQGVKAEPNKEIISILKNNYSYGFRVDSIREMMRFRQFAEEKEIALPEADDELKAMILASGSLIDGKVFCNSDDIASSLKTIIDSIFETGINVIYYESLLEVEAEWMSKHFITSEEMLKEVLQRCAPDYFFSKKFMLRVEKKPERESVTEEIIRVWGSSQTMAVDELDKKLPYIPLNNVRRVISGNGLFVSSAEGEYLYIKKLLITDEEITDIREHVELACVEKGFALPSDLPLGNIIEENYELSYNTIQNAIYKIALSDEYYINGKIITKDNGTLDAITLLKRNLYGKDTCAFSELSNKVIELTGVENRQYVFQALYDCMVRIDENHFVGDKMVTFDVEEIDRILKDIITDRFCAIKEITTFALFPVCGQSWNHYLLESYCYKYSKEYSLHILNFNDKNAGIIAEKDFDRSYFDMLAIALARKDVELTSEIAGTYLCSTGYMAKSKYANLNEIVAEAQILRKEG